jgi:hypothetical protein
MGQRGEEVSMLRQRAFAVVLVVVGALVLCGAASATTPQPVTMSVTTVFSDASDPFTSTGGVVCASGTVSTSFVLFNGAESGTRAQFVVGKHFVCSNGTFDLLLHATSDLSSRDDFGNWSVVSGTGAYALLHGDGTITGTAVVPGVSIDDEYTGSMHID